MTILCFDTETTGLNDDDEIVQLSVANAINGEELYNEYFRPSEELMLRRWDEASEVTGITPETVSECASIWEPSVRDDIQLLFDSADLVIGYNVAYDIKMMERAGFDMSIYVYDDAMRSFSLYYGVTHPDEMYTTKNGRTFEGGWFPWKHEYVNRNLTFAAEEFGITDFGAHDSMNDVMATIGVWNGMLDMQNRLEECDVITIGGVDTPLWTDQMTGKQFPLLMPDGTPVFSFTRTYSIYDLV